MPPWKESMSRVLRRERHEHHLLFVCCLVSAVILLASYLAQYLWQIEPCRLCKLQRLPYFFILCLSILPALKIKYGIIRTLLIFAFVGSSLLSAYHLLVIGGFISDFCAVKSNVATIDDFMSMLDTQVPCSKAIWKLLGLPMAAYNMLVSLFFLGLFVKKKPC